MKRGPVPVGLVVSNGVRLAAVLAAVLAVSFAACGAQNPKTQRPAARLLRHVPADTPYFFAVLEPTPRAELEQYLAMQRRSFHIRRLRLSEKQADRAMPPVVNALLDELEANLSVEGLDRLGIGAGATMALYGIGILPALRVEIKDARAVEALVGRMVAVAKGPPARTDSHGKVWQFPVGRRATVVVAVTDTELLAGVAPTGDLPWFLDRLHGDADPGPSLNDSPRLDEIMTTYRLSPRFVSWIELAAATVASTSDGSLMSRQWHALAETPRELSEACKHELVSLFGHMPRLVFGALETSVVKQRFMAMLELDPDLARELSSLRVSAVGVGAALGASIASFGVAADVPRLLAMLKARAQRQLQAPSRCPELIGLNELAQNLDAELSKPMPPWVKDLRGFAAELGDLQGGAIGPKIRGAAVVSAADPIRLIDLAKHFLPQLPSINPPPDGKPVKVPGGIFFVDAYVAMKGQLLGVGVGEGADLELVRLMGERPLASQPIAAFAADVAKLRAASSQFTKAADADEELFASDMKGTVSVTVSAEERGLRFEMVHEDRR